jgi:phage terminase large subunit-like protein
LARAKPGRLYLVVVPTYDTAAKATFRTLTRLARQLGLMTGSAKSTRAGLQLVNTAEILFGSADNPDSLRGPDLSGAWLDEGSLMVQEAYDVVLPTLREAGEQGWLTCTFTPKGLGHWTHEYFGQTRPNTALFHACTHDNPFLPKGFEETLLGQFGAGSQTAMQELAGKFVSPADAEWPGEYFEGPGFWFDDWPHDLTIKVISLDPSKGKESKSGDFQALVKFGRDRAGNEYVEADMGKRPIVAARGPGGEALTDGMVEATVRWCQEFRPEGLVVEFNTFQSLLAIPFETEFRRVQLDQCRYGINNTVNKLVRIRRLGAPLGQRRMRFKSNSPGTKLLVNQLRDFPAGEHDDGPDALEGARRLAIYLFNGKQDMQDAPMPMG